MPANNTETEATKEQLRKNLELNKSLLELYSKALDLPKEKLYQYFLSQVVKLTNSQIGFFHTVSEDQKTIILTAWNDQALKTCKASYDTHYPIEAAGNWVDCVKLKRSVIYNDFANSPNQKGLPHGHVPINRFMSVPVLDGDNVVIIFGVGNKVEHYSETDQVQVQLIANELFKIIRRRNLEEALKKSEAKYRALVENADEAILLSGLKGQKLFRNPAYFKQLGISEGESEDFATVHPDDLPTIEQNFIVLLKTGFSTSEYRIKHRTGKWIYRLSKSTLLYDEKAQPYAILSVIRDITKQKETEAELRANKEQLSLVNEKLRVVGSLTRHDVRNKLSAINCNSYLLKKKFSDNLEMVDRLNQIEQSVKESGHIFEFARMYEEIGAKELTKVNVEKALQQATALFSGPMPKIINKCQDLEVIADSFLRQLFYNLIDNSRKYGQKTAAITVSYQKNDKEQIELIYEDDGVGIPLENKDKIFYQGFSTGGSTGLGLFLIQKMVEVYGWTIKEDGEPGKGARFVITIPKSN